MRLIRFNLALAVSLSVLGGAASAQNAAPVVDGSEGDVAVASQPEPEPEPEPEQMRPQPIPSTLDDLIPQSAVDDAQGWAVGDAGEGDAPSAPEPVDPQNVPLSTPTAESFDVSAALDTFALPTAEPLEPDPERPSFAEIEAPDLIELPDLIETELSGELTLAFPAAPDAFPEEDAFIERFRALSAIEALESAEDTVPQLAARARSDEELLAEMLRTYGYYDGEILRQLSGGRRDIAAAEGETDPTRSVDADPQVRFDVLPGTRYRFGTVSLGALDRLPQMQSEELRGVFGIQPGDPLYADRILERSAVLRAEMGERGYPFAAFSEPQLLIDHARNEGDLTLAVAPNGRFVFGDVVSDDAQFLSSRHLQRIARFEPGETYQTSLQADLRRAILATGLVSSVAITPREDVAPADGEPGVVALDVALERAPLRTISGAIGYGTEDGFKLEAGWEHRNLFPPEGALILRGIVGTREQLASITYRRNNFRARDQILTVDAYASDIETEAVDARTVALRTSFERVSNLIFQKPLSWQLGAEVLYTDERNRVTDGVSRPRQTYLIGGLFGSATLDASDDLLDPTSGYRLTGFLAPEVSRSQGLESFYLRAQVDGSAYFDLGSTVLAGRVRGATIQGADVANIAPSRRLYAGGGGSVRGYGFQAIGPRDIFEEPTGGSSLIELAVEARIQTGFLDGAVEIVPFIDAGSVASGSAPDFEEIQFGAGVGVRYKTTFGPIRVDVGVPLNPTEFDAPVVVYVSLGQAF